MNSKRIKLLVLTAVLSGAATALHAADLTTVTGNSPSIYTPPNVQAVQKFLSAHQSTPVTNADILQFSATIERKESVASPVDSVATVFARNTVKTNGFPSVGFPTTAHDASATNTNAPCPSGFTVSQLEFSGNAICDQAATLPAGTLLNSVPVDPGTYVDSTLVVYANGSGISYEGSFSDGTPYPYGLIVQRIIDPSPNAPALYLGEYDNYFVADQATTNLLLQGFCNGVNQVTYVGPSPAGGGYQVQVAVAQPGTGGDSAVPSPLPPGDVNLCPPAPPSGS